jgi:predicted small lipoprotein YifL
MKTCERSKPWLIALGLAFAAVGLAACGVRGPLQPPAVAKEDGTAKSAESADPGSNSVVKPKPHEGFILDPLLR